MRSLGKWLCSEALTSLLCHAHLSLSPDAVRLAQMCSAPEGSLRAAAQIPTPPIPTASPILTPTSSHCLANLVSCVFSALYSVSPELSDC